MTDFNYFVRKETIMYKVKRHKMKKADIFRFTTFIFFSPCFTLLFRKAKRLKLTRLCLLKDNIAETNTADQPSIKAK